MRLRRLDAAGEHRARQRSATEAVLTHLLLVPPEIELVAWARLPRQTHRPVFPRAVIDSLLAEIRLVGPLRGIAGVLVREHAGDGLPVALVTERAVEPEP